MAKCTRCGHDGGNIPADALNWTCGECGRVNKPNGEVFIPKMDTGTAPSQNHYTQHAVQPIEIMQMYLSKEEFEGFLKGNVIKYSLRANYKGQKQKDVDKAYQYAKWLGQAQRGEKINPREG